MRVTALMLAALLAAARGRFASLGYDGTGLRDIAKACDMLPGSLHYRYASKEDILAALMERAIDRLIETFAELIETAGDDGETMATVAVCGAGSGDAGGRGADDEIMRCRASSWHGRPRPWCVHPRTSGAAR